MLAADNRREEIIKLFWENTLVALVHEYCRMERMSYFISPSCKKELLLFGTKAEIDLA